MKPPNKHTTKGFLPLFALMATFGSAWAEDAASAPATRIVFQRGATQAIVHGKLGSIEDEMRFVVRAKAGQHMVLKIDVRVVGGEGAGSVHDTVTYPDGSEEGLAGEYDLTMDGDYRITLAESRMGEEWQGEVTLTVRIK
jgi:hypothetical protein